MRRLVVLFMCVGFACSKSAETVKLLKPSEFQQQYAATPGAVLLDVRTQDEVQKGYIKGAMNFDFNAPEFTILMRGMDKSKTYFVYCASGIRSGKAAEQMKELDFKHVYLLDGGIKAWAAEGLPVNSMGKP